MLKLDANESTVPPSPVVEERLRAFVAAGGTAWYPDPDAAAVRRRVAAYASRPLPEVLVFNGSDMALECVVRALTVPGDRVCICSPCYDRFRVFAETHGAMTVPVYSDDPFTPSVSCLLEVVDATTRLLYVSNPNNPTGRMYAAPDLEELLTALTHGVLVVDEAYYEFAGETAAPLLEGFDNLVITRSLSKAFGLAGLRSGYTLSGPSVATRLRRIWNGREMNALAQVATIAALDDVAYAQRYVAEVCAARTWLTDALRDLGYEARSTPGNFILLRVDDPHALVADLRSRDIYIRDRSDLPQLEGYLRITVGTRAQCEQVLSAIQDAMAVKTF